jgi:hypothetical protein
MEVGRDREALSVDNAIRLLINVFFCVLIKRVFTGWKCRVESVPHCSFAAEAVECGRDGRIRGRIDLWLFVPLVIVCSIVFWMFIA